MNLPSSFDVLAVGLRLLGQSAPELAPTAESASEPVPEPGWWDPTGWDGAWLGPTGEILFAVLLVMLCFIAWGTNLVALPGNWIAVALLALYVWLGPDEGRLAIGFTPVIAAVACALIGELVEFFAGAAGAKRAGASRKSTLLAMVGSVVGAVVGAMVGIPVPVIGSVLAAILFAGVGATAGAMYGEWTDGRSWKESWAIGHAAFWGRTFGTLGKISVGGLILIIVVVALVI